MRTSVRVAPNVTPMIGVMLVLLIIFMVVAPMLLEGFPLDPPIAENLRARPEEPGDCVLGIDSDGRYYLNKRSIDAETLPTALRSIYTVDRLDKVLYLKADRRLEYAQVLAAVDVARQNGVAVVGMIAEQPAKR